MTEEPKGPTEKPKEKIGLVVSKLKPAIKKIRWPVLAVGTVLGLLILWAIYCFGLLLTIAIIAALFFLIYFYLAPNDIFFTFVKETTGKIVVRGGEFQKALIAQKGHTFQGNLSSKGKEEDNWEVIEGKEWHPFGGLRFYGFWPLDKIYHYDFEWTHLHEGGRVVVHKEKELDQILLKIDSYVVECKFEGNEAVEDIDGLPLAVKLVVPIRIVNPYVAVFITEKWLSLVTGLTKAVLREFIGSFRYKEDLINMRAGEGIKKIQEDKKLNTLADPGDDLTKILWNSLNDVVVKQEVTKEEKKGEAAEEIRLYGVAIVKLGFRILSVDPHPDFRKATTLKYVAEKEREATVIKAEATAKAAVFEAEARASQTGGLYTKIHKHLQEDTNMDEASRHELAADLTIRDQAGRNGELSILDIRGVSDPLAAAAAIYGEYSRGRGTSKQKQNSEDGSQRSKEKPGQESREKTPSKLSSFTTRDGTVVSFDKKSGEGSITSKDGKVITTKIGVEDDPRD
jgi:hypothetical protein